MWKTTPTAEERRRQNLIDLFRLVIFPLFPKLKDMGLDLDVDRCNELLGVDLFRIIDFGKPGSQREKKVTMINGEAAAKLNISIPETF